MSLFDTEEGVETYARMCEGYDGRPLVERVVELAPRPAGRRAELLELGMGLGTDLELLAEHFEVTGSDNSRAFLARYRAQHPDTSRELLELDAVTLAGLDEGRRFDLIFSNKVLHHLSRAELEASLRRQAELLRPGGLAFHTLWHGEGEQDHGGMRFVYYTAQTLAPRLPPTLTLELAERYTELEADDSLIVALRRA